MTELEAINRMLAGIGQAPVNSIDDSNPDVAICQRTLNQVSLEVQSEGWTFNSKYNQETAPDADERISIRPVYPASGTSYILKMDLSQEYTSNRNKHAIAKQDGTMIYLYDEWNDTFKWGTSAVYTDQITYYAELASLPPVAYNYIVAKATVLFCAQVLGDSSQFQMLQQQEAYCRVQLQEYETTQGDFTFFGHPVGSNFYNSYQPYHTLSRQ